MAWQSCEGREDVLSSYDGMAILPSLEEEKEEEKEDENEELEAEVGGGWKVTGRG